MKLFDYVHNTRYRSFKPQVLVLGEKDSGKHSLLNFFYKSMDTVHSRDSDLIQRLLSLGHEFSILNFNMSTETLDLVQNEQRVYHGVVLILDCSNIRGVQNALVILKFINGRKDLSDLPLLIFSNKIDNANSLDLLSVISFLKVEESLDKKMFICPVSCKEARGDVLRSFKWLLEAIFAKDSDL